MYSRYTPDDGGTHRRTPIPQPQPEPSAKQTLPVENTQSISSAPTGASNENTVFSPQAHSVRSNRMPLADLPALQRLRQLLPQHLELSDLLILLIIVLIMLENEEDTWDILLTAAIFFFL